MMNSSYTTATELPMQPIVLRRGCHGITQDSIAVTPNSLFSCFSTPQKLRKGNLVFIVKLYHLVDTVVLEAIASTILPTFLAASRNAVINIIAILSVVVFQNSTCAASLSLMKWLAM